MGTPNINRVTHHIEVGKDGKGKRVCVIHTGLELDMGHKDYEAGFVDQLIETAQRYIKSGTADSVHVVQDPEGFRV